MRLAQFARRWGFLVVLVLAGLGAGCDWGTHQAGPAEPGIGKVLREEQKQFHKQLKEDRAEEVKSKRADVRRGRHRG